MAYGTTLNGIRGAGGIPNLVTTLYTGTGAARSIVTGQNLAGGGLCWSKTRGGGSSHFLFDSVRGANKYIVTNGSDIENTLSDAIGFLSNGASVGTNTNVNGSLVNYVLWTFLERAGFLDSVSYTGDGTSGRAISHALGEDVGFAMIKSRNFVPSAPAGYEQWYNYHRSIGATKKLQISSTAAESATDVFNSTEPTSSQITVSGVLNASTVQYIAYLFAHNPAQKIFCGSFTTDGSGNATVTGLGFRPKWLMVKRTNLSENWTILDVERGWGSGNDADLRPNTSDDEDLTNNLGAPTSDGFTATISNSSTYIYMAIG